MPTVGAGFHARPASVYGQRRCARKNGARAVPAKSHTWSDGYKAGAPVETRLQAVTPNVRNARASAEVGWRVEPAQSVNRRRRTEDGAPYGANRSVQQQTHVVRYPTEGASRTPPPTGCARFRFQRSREVQFTALVTMYAASPVSLSPVGCTVLGAPRSRDCRAALDAVVRPDRFCPYFPRCVNRAFTDQRFIFRGHSPRTICGRIEIAPVSSHLAAYVSQPPVRGGVLDAPCLRDCRAALAAAVRLDRF